MKKIITIFYIFTSTAFAQVDPINLGALAGFAALMQTGREYQNCLCHSEVYPKIVTNKETKEVTYQNEQGDSITFDDTNVELKPTEGTTKCNEFIESLYTNSATRGSVEESLERRRRGADTFEGTPNPPCTQAAINDKLKEYSDRIKSSLDWWESKVEKEICNIEPPIENISPTERKCRNTLLDVMKDYQEQALSECKADENLQDKRSRHNRCAKEITYKHIYSQKNDDFITAFCVEESRPQNEDESQRALLASRCEEGIKSSLGRYLYEDDTKVCFDQRKLNTQTKSKIVCLNMILSNVFGFLSEEEKSAITSCIKSKAGGFSGYLNGNNQAYADCAKPYADADENLCFDNMTTDGNKLISELLPPNNTKATQGCISEKTLFEEVANRYCPVKLYAINELRQKCIEDLMKANMSLLDINADDMEYCQGYANDYGSSGSPENNAALKKCLRTRMYAKMLENNLLEVANCWDTSKYDSIRNRQGCTKKAEQFYDGLDKCEQWEDANQIAQCLSKLRPKEFTQSYLETKAVTLRRDVSMCQVNDPRYENCMMNRIYNQPDGINLLASNPAGSCTRVIVGCNGTEVQQYEGGANGSSLVLNPEGAVGNSLTAQNGDSNAVGTGGGANSAPGNTSVADGSLDVGTNGNNGQGSGDGNGFSPQGQGVKGAGAQDVYTDFAILTQTGGTDEFCRQTRRNSMGNLGNRALGTMCVAGAGQRAEQKLGESDDIQDDSLQILQGQNQETALCGQAMSQRGALIERGVQTNYAAVQHHDQQTGTQHTCPGKSDAGADATVFLNLDNFFEDEKRVESLVANLKTEKDKNNYLRLMREWDNYVFGNEKSSSEDYDLENEMNFIVNYSDDEFELLKESTVAGMLITREFLVDNSFARDDAGSLLGAVKAMFVNSASQVSDNPTKIIDSSLATSGKAINNAPTSAINNIQTGTSSRTSSDGDATMSSSAEQASAIDVYYKSLETNGN